MLNGKNKTINTITKHSLNEKLRGAQCIRTRRVQDQRLLRLVTRSARRSQVKIAFAHRPRLTLRRIDELACECNNDLMHLSYLNKSAAVRQNNESTNASIGLQN